MGKEKRGREKERREEEMTEGKKGKLKTENWKGKYV